MRLLALFWLVLGCLRRRRHCWSSLYFRSVAGALAVPVRDNEIRLEFLGISVTRLIHLKLVIAGMLAGIGGALGGARDRACRSRTCPTGPPPAASCS